MWVKFWKQKKKIKIFAVSMTDIEKALKIQKHTNSKMKLLTHYYKFLNIFDWKIAETLASARNKKINHQIKLKNINESKSESFWKLLYNMSCEKFLILQKTFIKYLNKNFIHVSNSFADTFVFFVKKSDKELHFYVDYYILNKLTKKIAISYFWLIKFLNKSAKLDDSWNLILYTSFTEYKSLKKINN